MSNRHDLWVLLTSRLGEWVSRDDLNFVGGSDASRRMREIREDIVRSGRYRLEERKDPKGRLMFRLTETKPGAATERYKWECTKCGAPPSDLSKTKRGIDPTYRLGKCYGCALKESVFRLKGPFRREVSL